MEDSKTEEEILGSTPEGKLPPPTLIKFINKTGNTPLKASVVEQPIPSESVAEPSNITKNGEQSFEQLPQTISSDIDLPKNNSAEEKLEIKTPRQESSVKKQLTPLEDTSITINNIEIDLQVDSSLQKNTLVNPPSPQSNDLLDMDTVQGSIILELTGALIFAILGYIFRERILKLVNKIKRIFFVYPPNKRAHFFSRNKGKYQYDSRTTGGPSLERYDYIGASSHSTIFGTIQSGSPATVRSEKNKPADRKRARFLAKCIVPYSLKIKNRFRSNNSDTYKDYLAEQIVQDLILPSFQQSNPQMIIVDGKVGTGKTTLINHIASITHGLNETSNNTPDVIVVYIDIRKLLSGHFDKDSNFYENIENVGIDIFIKEKLDNEIVRLLLKTKITGLTADSSVNDAINRIYSLHLRLIILIDELDFLYTDFSRRVVCRNGYPSNEFIDTYNCIFKTILKYNDECPYSSVPNLNTVVVVSARSNTIKLFEELGSGIKLDDAHLISIDTHSNQKAKDIFIKKIRTRLTEQGITREETDALNELIISIKDSRTSFTKNLSVSVHGLRHLVNLMIKLVDQDPTSKLLQEIFSRPSLLRLYQYLDGNPTYSQAYEGISNIFLVNSDTTKAKRKQNPKSLDYFDANLLTGHLHSYWMKYLICYYIEQKCKDHNESIPFDDIIHIFTPTGADSYKSYENNLVRLSLINASEVDHGRLIKFKHDLALQVMPTNRLLYIYENNLLWEFGYLMIVIEDVWLEFPKMISKEFEVNITQKSAYTFVSNYHSSTNKEKYEFILYKSTLVIIFYDLLSTAFKYEKKRYSDVFDNLAKDGVDTQLIVPDRSVIENSIIAFTERYLSEQMTEDITSHLAKEREKSKGRIKKIEKFYNSYHGSLTLVSMGATMAEYHNNLSEQ